MTDVAKIAPCPHCGCENIGHDFEDEGGYWRVWCEDCWSTAGFKNTKAEAFTAWNRRTDPAGLPTILRAFLAAADCIDDEDGPDDRDIWEHGAGMEISFGDLRALKRWSESRSHLLAGEKQL